MQQHLLGRQEHLFPHACVHDGAQPVPVPLPPLLHVGHVWTGRDVVRTCGGLAHSSSLSGSKERACTTASTNGSMSLPSQCLHPCHPATHRSCRLCGDWPFVALAPCLPAFHTLQLEGVCMQQRLPERQARRHAHVHGTQRRFESTLSLNDLFSLQVRRQQRPVKLAPQVGEDRHGHPFATGASCHWDSQESSF